VGLVIDTSTVAPHERTELWSATTSALFFPSELSFGAAASYAGWMARYTLGPLDLFRVRGHGPLTLDRTRRGIVRADPEFFALSILRRGRLRARQEDRTSHVGPGVMSVYDSSLRFRLRADEPFDQLVVTVPKALLGPQADRIAHHSAHPIPLDTADRRLTASLVQALVAELEEGGVGGSEQELADALLALLRGLYAPDVRPSARERLPAAHMRAIKAYIDEHLGDPTLGPESIARSQFISTRYLHALFEPEGLTVSRWVRTRRLERARRDLQDPALAAVPIGVIAARWGFSSPSRFSHAVRADLGCSPSQLRAAGARRPPPS
jgi:AraC-like DNA-binding protein